MGFHLHNIHVYISVVETFQNTPTEGQSLLENHTESVIDYYPHALPYSCYDRILPLFSPLDLLKRECKYSTLCFRFALNFVFRILILRNVFNSTSTFLAVDC